MATTVEDGRYFGFTQDELNLELEKYKTAVKRQGEFQAAAGGGTLAGGTLGGQSVQFMFPAGIASLEEWRLELQYAQDQLNGLDAPTVVDKYRMVFEGGDS